MARRFPFELIKDKNGNPVPKFLDAFEVVRIDGLGEPKYYGDMHPDGHFVIRKHVTDETGEHITFYFASPYPPPSGSSITWTLQVLEEAWPNRATLEYREYSEVF